VLSMDCICIFGDCHLEKLPKHYLFYTWSREAMYQSGNGSRNINQQNYPLKIEDIWICNWWNNESGWFLRIPMAMGCNRA